MANTLNEQEEKALIAALLGLADHEVVEDFVVSAHTHVHGECTGGLRCYSNCNTDMTKTLLMSAAAQLRRHE